MVFMNKKNLGCRSLFVRGAVFLQIMTLVSSHGTMLDPPQRSSLWRFGYPGAMTNYNDNELFCGGFNNQWNHQNGNCGVCGDPYQGPRLNEAGNRYGKGIIAKTYNEGQSIPVTIDLTANHQGYFEFRLCEHNNPDVVITEDCFDDHLLYIEEIGDTRMPITSDMGSTRLTMTVQLPSGVTCSQCVLRWKYNAGNNWNCDDTGNCGLGLGPQEQFYNCADIAIDSTGTGTTSTSTTTMGPSTSTSTTGATTTTDSTTEVTSDSTTTGELTSTANTEATTKSVADCARNYLDCVGVYPYDDPNHTTWCNVNCNWYVRNCPEHICSCVCLE